jgi:hypothetical protein
MEAKELRIGNLIFKNNEIYEISSLFFVDIHDGTIRDNNNYVIKPIPITLELLDKLGFTIENKPNEDIEYFYNESRFNLVHKTFFNIYYFCHDNIVLKKIKYIHEVQNLFFLLENVELKLKND